MPPTSSNKVMKSLNPPQNSKKQESGVHKYRKKSFLRTYSVYLITAGGITLALIISLIIYFSLRKSKVPIPKPVLSPVLSSKFKMEILSNLREKYPKLTEENYSRLVNIYFSFYRAQTTSESFSEEEQHLLEFSRTVKTTQIKIKNNSTEKNQTKKLLVLLKEYLFVQQIFIETFAVLKEIYHKIKDKPTFEDDIKPAFLLILTSEEFLGTYLSFQNYVKEIEGAFLDRELKLLLETSQEDFNYSQAEEEADLILRKIFEIKKIDKVVDLENGNSIHLDELYVASDLDALFQCLSVNYYWTLFILFDSVLPNGANIKLQNFIKKEIDSKVFYDMYEDLIPVIKGYIVFIQTIINKTIKFGKEKNEHSIKNCVHIIHDKILILEY